MHTSPNIDSFSAFVRCNAAAHCPFSRAAGEGEEGGV